MMLADAYDVIVFDCDGVLWTGGEAVAGAAETLEALEAAGKQIYFMTNNSSRGTDAFRAKFEGHGLGRFARDERRLWSSVTATKRWFLEVAPELRTAYVVGSPAMKDAVRSAGLEVVEPEPIRGASPDALADLDVDRRVDAVVLAFDRHFGYFELAYATRCLLENPGCRLVVTNRDFQFPARDGVKLPGNGSFVAALCAAIRREPDIVVAKPAPFALAAIAAEAGAAPRRVLMVGDMWSDVAFAHGFGADAALVL
eukprot:CAMPEP_0119290242 /NCGR_PEP_ID=MMETSP1329-20130426/40412_1 /TAXON_ID=114041 /ORGANISM="Genus nov. species nov., Strain RCC1024" /LENGTH=254 /DNA_ID=CAMNT_0007291057 /DNA_START=219 /DNA_END=980 /DNA_ORIENTATION=-